VVRQLPPVTLALAITLTPDEMTLTELADVVGLVRILALHRATFVTLAPRAVPGSETAPMAKTRIADSTEVATRAVSDA